GAASPSARARRRRPGRREGDLARAPLRVVDEVLEILPGRLGVHHDDHGVGVQPRDAGELIAAERGRPPEDRVDFRQERDRRYGDQQRVPVGLGDGHRLHAHRAGGAGLVGDDDRLLEHALERRRQRAAGEVRQTTRTGRGGGMATFAPLTPLGFRPRTAAIHPDRVAVIHGARRITYREFDERARRLASALIRRGIGPGDTVSALLPNVPAMLDAHFGVAMAGAVLNTINTRLDARTIAYILEHGEAKVLLTDREYAGTVGPALERLGT